MQNIRQECRRRRQEIEGFAGRLARRAGYEFRRSSFYLPFPEVDSLPEELWSAPHDTPGVDLRIDESLALLERLRADVSEFPAHFGLDNGSYGWGDAQTLWAMIRYLKPRRLIELGSGASSHLIAAAGRRNAAGRSPLEFASYDPFPGRHPMGIPPGATVHPIRAERLEPKVMDVLDAGDVLFVDTTHTVKTGGDVAHIYLHLLPRLSPGVFVHIHDIFLPDEYPRSWVKAERRAWAEQYLLQAFLAFNPCFEVILPVHALWRYHREKLLDTIPAPEPVVGEGPGAFWVRRVE